MLRYRAIGNLPQGLLESFRSYAHINGGDDQELIMTLKTALCNVQQYVDRALLACTIEYTKEIPGSVVKLYCSPILEVVSVKDPFGNDIPYTLSDDTIRLSKESSFVVRYITAPLEADIELYKIYAIQIASAIWDGNDEEELTILNQIPVSWC